VRILMVEKNYRPQIFDYMRFVMLNEPIL